MLPHPFGVKFDKLFEDQSDRGTAVEVCALIDHLLKTAIDTDKVDGSQPRDLRSRIDAAFALKWIDSDLQSDLHTLRTIRNKFAHEINTDSLDGEEMDQFIQSLVVPRREYIDWGDVKVASLPNGFVISNGELPEGAGAPLYIGRTIFQMGVEVILVVLVGSLPIGYRNADSSVSQIAISEYLSRSLK